MIRGYFDGRNRPYVECRLYIQRLDIDRPIRLLFDTGADRTCLNPRAINRIGISKDSLENPLDVAGIGRDRASFYREPAILIFFDTDGDRQYNYPVELLIAEETTVNQNLDSVLGRDVFDHWNTIYYPSENRLDFTVVESVRLP